MQFFETHIQLILKNILSTKSIRLTWKNLCFNFIERRLCVVAKEMLSDDHKMTRKISWKMTKYEYCSWKIICSRNCTTFWFLFTFSSILFRISVLQSVKLHTFQNEWTVRLVYECGRIFSFEPLNTKK